jgi:ribonucleoside-diphosphate reductase alpha chain
MCGDEFEALYESYEKLEKEENHQSAWIVEKILESQIETGTPYMLYKDATVNQTKKEFRNDSFFKFMYWDHGVYSPDEVAVWLHLHYLFVENGKFDHDTFYTVTKRVTKNLNSNW